MACRQKGERKGRLGLGMSDWGMAVLVTELETPSGEVSRDGIKN